MTTTIGGQGILLLFKCKKDRPFYNYFCKSRFKKNRKKTHWSISSLLSLSSFGYNLWFLKIAVIIIFWAKIRYTISQISQYFRTQKWNVHHCTSQNPYILPEVATCNWIQYVKERHQNALLSSIVYFNYIITNYCQF